MQTLLAFVGLLLLVVPFLIFFGQRKKSMSELEQLKSEGFVCSETFDFGTMMIALDGQNKKVGFINFPLDTRRRDGSPITYYITSTEPYSKLKPLNIDIANIENIRELVIYFSEPNIRDGKDFLRVTLTSNDVRPLERLIHAWPVTEKGN